MRKLQLLNATYYLLIKFLIESQALPFSQRPDILWSSNLRWEYLLTIEIFDDVINLITSFCLKMVSGLWITY